MFGGVKDNTYVDARKAYALLDMPTISPLGRCYGILVLVVRLLVRVLMCHACEGQHLGEGCNPRAPTLDLAMIAMYKTYLQYILICCTCGESRDSSTEI